MTHEHITIPCLNDNYAYVIANLDTATCILIDAPQATPILETLATRGLTLTHILITHHHDDHIQAVPEILSRYDAQVIGASADAYRLPPLDQGVADGQTIVINGLTCQVIDVSGHTIGHIAFYFPELGHAYTADSLMALGCGRLFEGTPEQMWHSLTRLLTLPDETIICSGHEYTLANAAFAKTIDPHNTDLLARCAAIQSDRDAGRFTAQVPLMLEKQTNPFLRPYCPNIRAALNMQDASDVAVFAEIRKRKDNF